MSLKSRCRLKIAESLCTAFYSCLIMLIFGNALHADEVVSQEKSPVLASIKLENGSTENLEVRGMKLRVNRRATKTGWSITLSGRASGLSLIHI